MLSKAGTPARFAGKSSCGYALGGSPVRLWGVGAGFVLPWLAGVRSLCPSGKHPFAGQRGAEKPEEVLDLLKGGFRPPMCYPPGRAFGTQGSV